MNSDGDLALVATGLGRRYRDDLGRAATAALDGIDLVLKAGEAAMLIGLNGAGKSTLLRLAAGVETADDGKLIVFGHGPRHPASRRRLGYLPDGAELFPFLDVPETLRFFAASAGLGSKETRREIDRLIELFAMKDWARKRAGAYSTGMRRRLALAAVLIGAPDLLLLDEPASGLDPEATRLFLEVLRAEKRRGAALLMASHHLGHAQELCDRVLVLARGRLVFDGDLAELAEHIGRRQIALGAGGPTDGLDPAATLAAAGFEVEGTCVSERGLEDFLISASRSR